jgi:hypothetical protein
LTPIRGREYHHFVMGDIGSEPERRGFRGAAFLLGIKYTTLYAKIKKSGLRFTKAVRFCQDSPITDFEWLGR